MGKLIVVADFPSAFYSPSGIGSVIALIEGFEDCSLGVPCDGNLVRFIGFEIEFDATAPKRFAECMASVRCSYSNVPFAILTAALPCGLAGEDVVCFFYASSLRLTDGNGFGSGKPIVGFCCDCDGARLSTAATSRRGCRNAHSKEGAEDQCECDYRCENSFSFCHFEFLHSINLLMFFRFC